MQMQPCSVANLLSTTFKRPLPEMYIAVGLKLCPWCQLASRHPEFYPFCNKSCLYRFNTQKVPLECSECGEVFLTGRSEVLHRTKANKTGRIFCSRKCHGAYTGRTYGFGAHKKPPRRGTHCLHGHEQTVENTQTITRAGRTLHQCRQCSRDWAKRYYYKQKGLTSNQPPGDNIHSTQTLPYSPSEV